MLFNTFYKYFNAMDFDSALEKVSAFKPIQLAAFTFVCLSKSFVFAIVGASIIFIGEKVTL